MSTAKSRREPVPHPQRLAAPRGTAEAAVEGILLGASRAARVGSFEGHAHSGGVCAVKHAGADLASAPARRERAGA